MPGDWYERGLKVRQDVLTPEYVEQALKEAVA